MDKTTAREMWDALHELSEASSKDQLFRACNNFFLLAWTELDDVATHASKLHTLWNEINDGPIAKKEHRLPDMLLVCKMFNILPKKFELFILHERNFIPIKAKSSEALPATTTKKNSAQSVHQVTAHSPRVYSNYCGKPSHFVQCCKKWQNGSPSTKKDNPSKQTAAANLLAFVSICYLANAVKVN